MSAFAGMANLAAKVAVMAGLLGLFGPAEWALAAKSPFGVGLPEPMPPTGGMLSGLFGFIAARQAEFYRALTGAIGDLRADGSAFWVLAGLSFAYGIFHAAGPGHGKAILSSYVIANERTARRGILLSFAAALMQALVAIALISIAAAVLNLTSFAITDTARYFEIGSYAMVTGLGLWLVWDKVVRGGHHHHDGAHGHGHIADPLRIGGDALSLREAGSVVLAIGLRPCTGALVVLVFALSQGLFIAGIAATLVMGVGTGLTVALLVLVAVGAKDLAVRLVGGRSSVWADRVLRIAEVAGAVVVLVLGLVLLTAAIGWR